MLRFWKLALGLIVVALLAATAAWLAWSPFGTVVPEVSTAEVEAIEVYLFPYPKDLPPGVGQDEAQVSTADPAAVAELLGVFRSARRATEHKCGHVGTITLRKRDGQAEELHILPGHDRRYYEYRYRGEINRMDRERFLDALRRIGVKDIKVKPP